MIFLYILLERLHRRQIHINMRKNAYVVVVGTEPGVYDDWTECADKIMGVPGSIYKGYASRIEAEDVFRRAQAAGRTKVVLADRMLGALDPITLSRIPPVNAGTTASSRRPPRAHPVSSSRPTQTAPAPTTSGTIQPVSQTHPAPSQSPRRSPRKLKTELSSPSSCRVTQIGTSSSLKFTSLVSSSSVLGGETSQSLRILPPSPEQRSRPGSPSSILTGVTMILPDSPTHSEGSHSISPERSPVRSLGTTATRSNSSPTTGVTHIEPALSAMSIADASPPSITFSSSSASLPVHSSRRSHRTYADVGVQTTLRMYTPRTTPSRTPSLSQPSTPYITAMTSFTVSQTPTSRVTPASTPTAISSPTHPTHVPTPHIRATHVRSPRGTSTHSPAGAGRLLSRAHTEPVHESATLSPLGLGLSQPMHTSGMVYDAASDPRSPIRRTASVPTSNPTFHRPSPALMSISDLLSHS